MRVNFLKTAEVIRYRGRDGVCIPRDWKETSVQTCPLSGAADCCLTILKSEAI